jgi:hypothetical protein
MTISTTLAAVNPIRSRPSWRKAGLIFPSPLFRPGIVPGPFTIANYCRSSMSITLVVGVNTVTEQRHNLPWRE